MRDEMNQMIDEVFNTARGVSNQTSIDKPTSYRRPVTEVNEKDGKYDVTVELPGVRQSDIDLTANNHLVTINVNRSEEEQQDDMTRRTQKSFYRTFTMPKDAQMDQATAKYSNGVLELCIPKRASDDKQTIEIQ